MNDSIAFSYKMTCILHYVLMYHCHCHIRSNFLVKHSTSNSLIYTHFHKTHTQMVIKQSCQPRKPFFIASHTYDGITTIAKQNVKKNTHNSGVCYSVLLYYFIYASLRKLQTIKSTDKIVSIVYTLVYISIQIDKSIFTLCIGRRQKKGLCAYLLSYLTSFNVIDFYF